MDNVTIVYVRADSAGHILQCEGGVSERNIKNPAEWVELDRGAGARYEFCQEYYFDRPIYTDDGIPRYKLVDGQAVERTQEEIEADRAAIPAPPPTAQEQLRADVDFLAAMQGVSL